jgi:hypothetical protein
MGRGDRSSYDSSAGPNLAVGRNRSGCACVRAGCVEESLCQAVNPLEPHCEQVLFNRNYISYRQSLGNGFHDSGADDGALERERRFIW